MLLLGGLPEHEPSALTRARIEALVEPLASAVRHYVRQRDAAELHEAAEADRRSLLSRLGRKDVAEAVVGADSGLRDVMERVAQVARSDAPVLLLGETGSGKEVVARAIHRQSPRAEAPFIRLNCGAIPGDLVDSELFGHERGSFTGAVALRRGWFERADGGTLFLDEVGELSAGAQTRLLRVLQEGEIDRLSVDHFDIVAAYTDFMMKRFSYIAGNDYRRLKVVIDAGNGTGGIVAPKIAEAMGCEVIPLYCEPDGRFPNHHPDPTGIEYIRHLITLTKEKRADIGAGYDGDADRIGAVNRDGKVIWGDQLMIILSRDILKKKPGAVIIGDVKCSQLMFDDIERRGGIPVMWKTGHSLVDDAVVPLISSHAWPFHFSTR